MYKSNIIQKLNLPNYFNMESFSIEDLFDLEHCKRLLSEEDFYEYVYLKQNIHTFSELDKNELYFLCMKLIKSDTLKGLLSDNLLWIVDKFDDSISFTRLSLETIYNLTDIIDYSRDSTKLIIQNILIDIGLSQTVALCITMDNDYEIFIDEIVNDNKENLFKRLDHFFSLGLPITNNLWKLPLNLQVIGSLFAKELNNYFNTNDRYMTYENIILVTEALSIGVPLNILFKDFNWKYCRLNLKEYLCNNEDILTTLDMKTKIILNGDSYTITCIVIENNYIEYYSYFKLVYRQEYTINELIVVGKFYSSILINRDNFIVTLNRANMQGTIAVNDMISKATIKVIGVSTLDSVDSENCILSLGKISILNDKDNAVLNLNNIKGFPSVGVGKSLNKNYVCNNVTIREIYKIKEHSTKEKLKNLHSRDKNYVKEFLEELNKGVINSENTT